MPGRTEEYQPEKSFTGKELKPQGAEILPVPTTRFVP